VSDTAKRTYFNELAARWDEMLQTQHASARVAAFCERACPAGARWVLDVGAGTGVLVLPLLERLGSQARLIELDFAFEMLRRAVSKTSDARLLAVCADAMAMPFPPGLFDAVLCFGILPHLGPAAHALARLWEAVAPAGVLAIGHLMGSSELNARHRSFGGPIAADFLPEADEVARLLVELGAVAVEAEDSPSEYFVRASKGI
jgi:ubiquinone/menaquinone biosynthesis C-methylase UbiE